MSYASDKKSYVIGQYLAKRRDFERQNSPGLNEASFNELAHKEFETSWADELTRIAMIPGKEAFSHFNNVVQHSIGLNVTPTLVIDSMRVDEIPLEMTNLIKEMSVFAKI